MQISQKKIKVFQEKILNWYALNKRDLPWRNTRDPYRILISEVMSQQTQVNRVVLKYVAWLEKFPSVHHLAEAPVSEVLRYWSGLGYNRRALNLKRTAEKIVVDYHGVFPRTEKELIGLPGIGRYTARAILCFAFNQQVTVVDTNVRKVIVTQILSSENDEGLCLGDADVSEKIATKVDEQVIEALAIKLLPAERAYDWNQALMDYSSAVLKKEKIPIPKQSKFIGSRRFYRGKILKVLLDRKSVKVSLLGPLIKEGYSNTEKEWLQKLLDEMIEEGFIIFKKNTIHLV